MKYSNILRHKWVIPIAALILVLSIGAGAWAATGTSDSTTQSTQATQSTTPSNNPNDQNDQNVPCGRGGGWGRGHMMRGDWAGKGDNDGTFTPGQRLQDAAQALRDKMSADDQKALDDLLNQAKTQGDTLKKAAQDLRDTMQQLRDLLGKYQQQNNSGSTNSSPAPSTSTPSTSGSTESTGATGATTAPTTVTPTGPSA